MPEARRNRRRYRTTPWVGVMAITYVDGKSGWDLEFLRCPWAYVTVDIRRDELYVLGICAWPQATSTVAREEL